MKYKLINSVTKIETLCEKITIEGFDYYVSGENPENNDTIIYKNCDIYHFASFRENYYYDRYEYCEKVIATNNPNIDVPKVVDIKLLKYKIAEHEYPSGKKERSHTEQEAFINGWKQCLQSQETHPYSAEDMVEFAEWRDWYLKTLNEWKVNGLNGGGMFTTKELLQIWKDSKPKIVYYE